MLLESLWLAREADLPADTARAMLNLVGVVVGQRRYDLPVAPYLELGRLLLRGPGAGARPSLLPLLRGARSARPGPLPEATEHAAAVLRVPRTSISPRIRALEVLGLVRARRGDPGVWEPLDEAWELAAPTGELPRLGSIAAARAEAAWLAGDPARLAEATDAVSRWRSSGSGRPSSPSSRSGGVAPGSRSRCRHRSVGRTRSSSRPWAQARRLAATVLPLRCRPGARRR